MKVVCTRVRVQCTRVYDSTNIFTPVLQQVPSKVLSYFRTSVLPYYESTFEGTFVHSLLLILRVCTRVRLRQK